MALLKNTFFSQISLATIQKKARSIPMGDSLEFWEADIVFDHNKSDFSFTIKEPKKNSITKVHKRDDYFDLEFSIPTSLRGNVKRFWNEDEAEAFVLFNLIQIYKPLKNYVDDNDIVNKFNELLEKYPEKIFKELEGGKKWIVT